MAGDSRGGDVISVWEWATAALGVAIVVAVIWIIGGRAVDGEATPPSLTVRVQGIAQRGDGWAVDFEVLNAGDDAATGVEVQGMLDQSGGAGETSHAVVDYVAGHSRAGGALLFSLQPTHAMLRVRPIGYRKP